MDKICAVIVTYNRKKLLLRNIQSIMSQSAATDILIYDNDSPDKPWEYLQQNGVGLYYIGDDENPIDDRKLNNKGISLTNIYYYKAFQNTGGAGGFSEGISLAYKMGYDYIWLMDDDGYCINHDTLSILLSAAKDENGNNRKAIFNSLVLSNPVENGGDDLLSFSMLGERYLDDEHKSMPLIKGEISSFNSTLFHRQLVDTIGTVNPDFFIYGDDTDYLERAIAAGYELITVTASRYYHPDSGMGYRKVLGRTIALREMNIRNTYLYTRNYMYIMKHYRTKQQAVLHIPKVLLKCIFYQDERWLRTKATVLGLLDGWHDRLGHPKKYGY